LASVLGEIIVMGGAIDRALPAEFNLRSDPRAAQEALSSGAAITLVPIDLSLGEAAHTPADCEKLEAIGTPQAEFVLSMCYAGMRTRNVVGLPDAIAMAIALDRSLIRRSNPNLIEVGNDGEIALQPAVVVNQEPSVEVVEEIDAERYKAVLRNACL
jgi:inosine-uridine nucleoside N-ribohydrolase